jgi:farnesyl diphosphate synthase
LQTDHVKMNFDLYCQTRVTRIEQFLANQLPEIPNDLSCEVPPLFKAMRYAVLNGGKRIRPLLVYATGEAFGYPLNNLDAPAAAVELVHCYSLIHDDLPAMDNDDLRRGQPTCHKAFDEATAILAGDALLTLAFELLTNNALNPVSAEEKIQMIQILAQKSGRDGMVGGQALDLASEGKQNLISLEELRQLHYKKTGALIEASVTLGAVGALHTGIAKTAENVETIMLKLQEYARCIGLAFQIQDDILDIVSNTETLGKTAGKDQKQNKATFPNRLSVEKAKQYANALHQQALDAIHFLRDKNHYLQHLSDLFIHRAN